jgi:hypothetical protein
MAAAPFVPRMPASRQLSAYQVDHVHRKQGNAASPAHPWVRPSFDAAAFSATPHLRAHMSQHLQMACHFIPGIARCRAMARRDT